MHIQANTGPRGPIRSSTYPDGTAVSGPNVGKACCAVCTADPDCVAWVAASGPGDGTTPPRNPAGNVTDTGGENCWPLNAVGGVVPSKGRVFGYVRSSGG